MHVVVYKHVHAVNNPNLETGPYSLVYFQVAKLGKLNPRPCSSKVDDHRFARYCFVHVHNYHVYYQSIINMAQFRSMYQMHSWQLAARYAS